MSPAAERIAAAYNELIDHYGEPHGTWVRLAELREQAGLTSPDFDAALIQLGEDGYANLVPQSDQWNLTEADRDAALWYGDQYKHLVSM